MEYKYASYWKQVLSLIIDGVVGLLIGSTLFLVIGRQTNLSLNLIVFISSLVIQVLFYYGYGNKSFGESILGLRVIFIEKDKNKVLQSFLLSFGKNLVIVPYAIPLYGPILALFNVLITIALQFIPKYKQKKQSGWN